MCVFESIHLLFLLEIGGLAKRFSVLYFWAGHWGKDTTADATGSRLTSSQN